MDPTSTTNFDLIFLLQNLSQHNSCIKSQPGYLTTQKKRLKLN